MTQRLIATLEPVVGAGKIRASVTVDHTQGSTEESDEKYDPAVQALLSDQKSEETSQWTRGRRRAECLEPQAIHPRPRPPNPQTRPDPPTPSQTSTTESAQYGVNKTVVHTVMPAGQIQRVSAAILVDDTVTKTVQGGKTVYTRRKWTPDELSKIQGHRGSGHRLRCQARRYRHRPEMPFDSENVAVGSCPAYIDRKGPRNRHGLLVDPQACRPACAFYPGLHVRSASHPETSPEPELMSTIELRNPLCPPPPRIERLGRGLDNQR